LPSVNVSVKEGDAPRMLVHVVGNVTGSEVKASTFGDNTRFMGMFEMINIETGETARGSSMYLPGHAETVLADAFSSAQGRPIQFALAIGIKFRLIAGKPGSEYFVQEIGGITEYDPLAGVKAQFGLTAKTVPALEAPAEVVAEAPAEVVAEAPAEVAAEAPAEPLEAHSTAEGQRQAKIDAEAEAAAAKKGGKKAK
jgi:hypothetical protein